MGAVGAGVGGRGVLAATGVADGVGIGIGTGVGLDEAGA